MEAATPPRTIVVACIAVALAFAGNVASVVSHVISPRTFGFVGLVTMLIAVVGLTSMISKWRRSARVNEVQKRGSVLRLWMFRSSMCIFPVLLIIGWLEILKDHVGGIALIGPVIGSLINFGFTYGSFVGASQEKQRLLISRQKLQSA